MHHEYCFINSELLIETANKRNRNIMYTSNTRSDAWARPQTSTQLHTLDRLFHTSIWIVTEVVTSS